MRPRLWMGPTGRDLLSAAGRRPDVDGGGRRALLKRGGAAHVSLAGGRRASLFDEDAKRLFFDGASFEYREMAGVSLADGVRISGTEEWRAHSFGGGMTHLSL